MNRDERQPLLGSREDTQRDENGVSSVSYQQQDGPSQNGEVTQPCLSLRQKIAFGLGHIYNDLCAAMWFSYTLLFLQAVLGMESAAAGSMVLLGQVMDALATPVVGIFADKWGSKRLWHLAGTGLVLCSFPLIFSRCLGCWMSSAGDYLRWWQPFYYGMVIIVFQCGWAIVQISHLAMIPTLTENLLERSELTAIRYTGSVCSGVTVYVITWTILKLGNNDGASVGPTDDYKFRNVALLLTAIGCALSITFHCGLHHQIKKDARDIIKKRSNGFSSDSSVSSKKSDGEKLMNGSTTMSQFEPCDEMQHKKKNFFLSPFLYQAALLYVASRLFSALSLVYMPLFLDERLNSQQSTETVESIASVPLASYITSFFSSLLLKYRSAVIDNCLLYTVGSILSIFGCMWVAISLDPTSGPFQLYAAASLLGAGSSITMVSSLCITADLIGPHSDQGAVVYSIVTFADKLITGVAVVSIENMKCVNPDDCPEYYRNILAFVCGGSALLGLITILISKLLTFIVWKH